MLFVMHFGWYLGLYFGFFTSDGISDDISDAFRISGCGGKKINIKTGGLPPALWFRFLLLTCLWLHLVLYSSFAHTQDSGVDQVDVSPYQAGFQLNWCFCTSFGRNPLCSCPHIC